MSEDNIHPVVRLLAKRMESNPEEFGLRGTGRWAMYLEDLHHLATPEEKLLLRTARMNELHEQVMDELLNGDERRAEERRKVEEAEKRYAMIQQQQSAAVQLYGQTQGITLGSNQYANHIAPANLRLGNEVLDEGILKQIKKKLGL